MTYPAANEEIAPAADAVGVQSTRFGTFSVPEQSILQFPDGLVGFPDYHRFVVMEHPSASPLRWLLCLDEPELAFAIIDPAEFFLDYDPRAATGGDVPGTAVFALVTIPPAKPAALSANLMAPIVVDVTTRTARQVVLDDGTYSTRHALLSQVADT